MTINGATTTYADYQMDNTAPKTETSKADEVSKADETSKAEEAAKPAETTKQAEDAGAVYEKSDEKTSTGSGIYNINKMSAADREALVKQLKADAENRQNQLMSLVQKMMTGQANTFAKTDDSIWKFLAKGDFTVDAATKAQAQKDLSEDGYWGIKETSKRLFDFASALAGDDVDKMKEMQNAMRSMST